MNSNEAPAPGDIVRAVRVVLGNGREGLTDRMTRLEETAAHKADVQCIRETLATLAERAASRDRMQWAILVGVVIPWILKGATLLYAAIGR